MFRDSEISRRLSLGEYHVFLGFIIQSESGIHDIDPDHPLALHVDPFLGNPKFLIGIFQYVSLHHN